MITHIFYHQETVEEQCAINSWLSIRDCFQKNDEVIILDLGNTLHQILCLKENPKFLKIEKIRTDIPEERSYTYGLNLIMPLARNENICLWRSDYIYNKKYFLKMKELIEKYDVVLPYEAFIGGNHCSDKWCKDNLDMLMNADEKLLLEHAHVCPTHETYDYPHFFIKKKIWNKIGGMNNDLWGYGYQFPDLFYRVEQLDDINININMNMIAFHQNHKGSFSVGTLNNSKVRELKLMEEKLLKAFGNQDSINKIKNLRHQPLIPRREDSFYKTKEKINLKSMVSDRIRNVLDIFKFN